MRHRPRARFPLIAAGAATLLGGAASPGTEVTVSVNGLRSARGDLLVCLTRQAGAFPDCTRDSGAMKARVAADRGAVVRFTDVPQGRWAIAVVHDENGNGRLDTMMGIPREGYGFSRDAPVRMGPPKFADAAFAVDDAEIVEPIRVRYIF